MIGRAERGKHNSSPFGMDILKEFVVAIEVVLDFLEEGQLLRVDAYIPSSQAYR
jgi:hypothetical protein